MRTIRVQSKKWQELTIAIHPNTAKEMDLENSITLTFGVRKETVSIHKTEIVEEWTFSLSDDLREKLLIPLFVNYEWKRLENELILGPFIAFYGGAEDKHALRRIKVLGKYTQHYSKLNGALVCFSAEGVDLESKTINGYIFEPVQKRWIKGKYSYPAAIFRNVRMNETFRKDYIEQVGKTIMNERILGKWEMHQILSKSKELRRYLPNTVLYQSPMDIFRFLKTEPTVYLKPVDGFKGSRIVKVKRDGKNLLVSYKSKKQLIEKNMTPKAAALFFKKRFKKNSYLVQQGLDIHHEGRLIDFRVMVVKDANGKWKSMGFIGKSIEANAITSNMATGGKVENGVKVLKQRVGLNSVDAAKVAKRMKSIGIKIGKVLDSTGEQFGNLGIDISIDSEGKIWIIEVNHRGPLHALLRIVGKESQYRRILETNMLYAKKLAGF